MQRRPRERTASEAGRSARHRAGQEWPLCLALHFNLWRRCKWIALLVAVETLIVAACTVVYLTIPLPSFLAGESSGLVALAPGPATPPLPPVSAEFDGIVPFDTEPRVAVSFSNESQFGVACTKLRDPRNPDSMKLLTGHENGATNNTLIRVDAAEYRFGRETENCRFLRDKKGTLWKDKEVKSPVTGGRQWLTIMDCKHERMRVTQSVEVIVSETTRLYDTVLVKYTFENRDETQPHTVSLRLLLDTQIGANDGVPFEIGPSEEVKEQPLVDTTAVFTKSQVPIFIRGIENVDDLGGANMTITEMGLKLRGFEPIDKVVICRWPGKSAGWEWEPSSIKADPECPDSCVALYWNRMLMNPAEKRLCGFTYGLGRIAGPQWEDEQHVRIIDSARLRLLARPAVVNRQFVLSAFVKGGDGQTATLELAPELEIVQGAAERAVATEAGKPCAHLSWLLKSSRRGTFTVKVRLSDGTVGTESVNVTPCSDCCW
jgi:hypothetical protein